MNLEEAGELFFPLVLNEYGKKIQGIMLYILNIQCDVLSH